MVRINLLGEQEDTSLLYILNGGIVSGLFLITMCICLVHYDINATNLSDFTDERASVVQRLEQLREKTKNVETLDKDKALLREKLTTIAELKAKKHGPVHILSDLTEAIPKEAWLTSMSEKGTGIEFQGLALDSQTISVFMKKLEASPYFSSVDLLDSRMQKRDEVPMQKFIILAGLRSALAVKNILEGKDPSGGPKVTKVAGGKIEKNVKTGGVDEVVAAVGALKVAPDAAGEPEEAPPAGEVDAGEGAAEASPNEASGI